MEYIRLGNTDIEVSRLCAGCMSFGDPASKMHAWTLNPQESEEIIRHALDLGINFFDTANCYSAGTRGSLRRDRPLRLSARRKRAIWMMRPEAFALR